MATYTFAFELSLGEDTLWLAVVYMACWGIIASTSQWSVNKQRSLDWTHTRYLIYLSFMILGILVWSIFT